MCVWQPTPRTADVTVTKIAGYMFASAFSWIGDFFLSNFAINAFYATATLLNIWICMQWTDAADGGCGGGQCDENIPSLSRSARRPLLMPTGKSTTTGVDFEP